MWLCFGVAQISTIQSLVGQRGRRWVMGVISQLEDGHFYLEDLTASVEINLSKAISFTYFYFLFYLFLELEFHGFALYECAKFSDAIKT